MKSPRRPLLLLGVLFALLNLAASCSNKPHVITLEDTGMSTTDQGARNENASRQLERRVPTLGDISFERDFDATTTMPLALKRAGEIGSEAPDRPKVAETTPLDQAATAALLARLEPLDEEPGDAVAFAKRERSTPPPKTGAIIATAFPAPSPSGLSAPDADRAAEASAPLQIVRHAPDGEVAIAPHVSVTFNQPMVAVTSISQLAEATSLPVSLEPDVPGTWRWVGAKTLLFEPEGERLPMATTYRLAIDPEAKSKSGQPLKGEAPTFEFRTPPPKITRFWPDSGGTRPRDQIVFMQFDQRIDPQEILEHVRIKKGMVFGTVTPVLATAEQIAADEDLSALIDAAPQGQWIALKADGALPYDANVTVSLERGAPSREGPLKTTEAQSYDFRTFGPLRVTEHHCGWGGECVPNMPFSLQFSNTLDQEQDLEELVTVEPSFPSMSISNYNNYISIQGAKPGRRDYTVTLSESLRDEHDQKLDGERVFTFSVGAERPWISASNDPFVVLDPSGAPSYTLHSMNIDEVEVKRYRVEPKDWNAFSAWHANYGRDGKIPGPPGKALGARAVKIKGEPDVMTSTALDLSEEFGQEGLGHLVLEITPTRASEGSALDEESYRPVIKKWLQRTQIGLDAFVDAGEFIGWATTLQAGEPLEGVKLELTNHEGTFTTGKDGIATLSLKPGASAEGGALLIARRGKDVALLPEHAWGGAYASSNWVARSPGDEAQFFVFDDRGIYRPEESVHVKGWVRRHEAREGGDVALLKRGGSIDYVAFDSQNVELARGSAAVSALGGFDFSFDLPETPNLGAGHVQLTLSGASLSGSLYHPLRIEEFRSPEFEVSTTTLGEGPFLAGEEATVRAEASYFAGGALPGAEVTWSVTSTPSSYTPPNRSEYTFGSWTPWWRSSFSADSGAPDTKTFTAKTDVTGADALKLEFGLSQPPRPMQITAQARVIDVNRQAIAASTSLLVHPSAHYVGLRSEAYFVQKGEPLEIDVIVTDIDGAQLPERPVKVRAARVKWAYKKGEYTEELVDPQICEIVTESDKPSSCQFQTEIGGQYKITATTLDDYGRATFSEFSRWVSGGDLPVSRRVEREKVEMIPDRDTYRPGQTASLLVQSPFVPAEGILTIRRSGITEERRFTMSEATTTLTVPIKSGHVPNLHVHVNLVGSAPRLDERGEPDESLPRRPAYAAGAVTLPVPPLERTLKVELEPASGRLAPGETTDIAVRVTGAKGEPVSGAEVALVVVDESILSLSGYAMADPLELFYRQREPGANDYHLRQYLELVDPTSLRPASADSPMEEDVIEGSSSEGGPRKMKRASPRSRGGDMMMESAFMAAPPNPSAMSDSMGFGGLGTEAGGGGAKAPMIAVRSDFNPLAAFAPAVTTGADGSATLSVKMPDNLTRYRVMAVAVEGGTRFGKGESAVTARLPLMVRPSPPRFLNFGDTFELPIVLQNQTDEAIEVQLAARATNISMTSTQGLSFSVPANDRVEVRFPAAAEQAGTARFQVATSAGGLSDAARFELPVWTPATSEAFATYGVLDEGAAAQPIKAPQEAWPQFGQLSVTTSSTALQSLTDAFLYLYYYRYDCTEQIASRMLSIAALRDVLSAFEAEGMPTKAEIERSMSHAIEDLISRQNSDGGFGFWRRGQPSWPYVSLHAAHALTRAEQKGYDVPTRATRSMTSYLTNIESHLPHHYSKRLRDHISAYALYLRALRGDRDTAKTRALIKGFSSLEDATFGSLGWLLYTLAGDSSSVTERAELKRFLNNHVTETAGAAHFASSISQEEGYLILHSDRNADAIILEALIEEEPKSDLIPKIVTGLLAHRRAGRWSNTQENAFVLLSLDKYFAVYEKQTPDFVARVWLGDTYAGDHRFKGRTTEQHLIQVPMSTLMSDFPGEPNLIVQRDGTKGKLYYRVGMTYAPKSLTLEPMDRGFVVERTYEAVEEEEDVTREADGSWRIKAGAKVRVKLTLVAPTRRYHVALVDPLPAGLEALNPALATTEDLPQDPSVNTGRGGWWWWSRPWFEHQNLRDERTEAFTTLLWGGVHTYTYYARATTPGEFVVPPTKAEEMYHPETFGRSSTDRVHVID